MDTANYFDFKQGPSLFDLVPKDDDDQFPLKVSKKEKLNHDTYLFELEYPNAEWISGLWVGGHFVFHATIDGKLVSRKYTPVSPINLKGRAEFVIKIYRPHPDFPEGGKFTQHLENNVNVGDSIICEGPIGKIKYFGDGKFNLLKKELPRKTKIGLLAGGSGITPMFSIAQAASLAKEGFQVRLLFSNKTKHDILIKDYIEELEKINQNFKAFHTLTRHEESHGEWSGFTGRVTLEMIRKSGFPEPAEDTIICICGPTAFKNDLTAMLTEAGYDKECVV